MQRLRVRFSSRPGLAGRATVSPWAGSPRTAGLLVAAVLAAAGGAAGCSSGGSASTVTAPEGGPPAGWVSPAPTGSPSAVSPVPARPTPPTGPSATPGRVSPSTAAPSAGGVAAAGVTAPAGGLCPTSRLSVRSADGEGAAGSTYEKLVLTNTGSTSCLLRGFPGVSYVDEAGRQVGAAATRTGATGAAVRLAPGGSATATLRTVHPGIQQGCEQPDQTAPVAALRIYPPANTAALRLPLSGVTACTDPAVTQLSVTAFTG
ncbi:DUF4232 domain-containing protein [Frankia sp. AgB32]|uniref:DUF4232 domain-containing protein n=1 Tax=Frankia sp. AgB32 TaxID=631119 RepID=UPI00200BE318|nr:DUF4232 domain-containing protein [Frankia sp. AgB32]MCK9897604.1 DUF4232 domain-containing protein [Frankia sp. AgB32]